VHRINEHEPRILALLHKSSMSTHAQNKMTAAACTHAYHAGIDGQATLKHRAETISECDDQAR
jgi:hypothetical protein